MIISQVFDSHSPDVSVIIPTYNRISMLEEALANLFTQEFDGIVEVIVVDDYSNDGTAEVIAQKYPQVQLIALQENAGAYVARNKGLLAARGTFIAFLDSDDLWQPNYLATQVATLENKQKHICVSAIELQDTLSPESNIFTQQPDMVNYVSPIHQLVVRGSFIFTPSSVLFPKAVFDNLGLFDESFRVGGDREFYLRCLLSGYNLVFNPEPLAILRRHTQGQLTDATPKKIVVRRNTRIFSLQKYLAAITQNLDDLTINQLYTEIHLVTAQEFLGRKYILYWLLEYRYILKYASLEAIVSIIANDFSNILKRFLKVSSRYIGVRGLNRSLNN